MLYEQYHRITRGGGWGGEGGLSTLLKNNFKTFLVNIFLGLLRLALDIVLIVHSNIIMNFTSRVIILKNLHIKSLSCNLQKL